MPNHAAFKTSAWKDLDWTSLPEAAQRMYWLLLSQGNRSNCGALPLQVRRWALLAEDSTIEGVQAALDILCERHFILTDTEHEEVLIRTFLKHDNILAQPQMVKSMWNAFEELHSPALQEAFRAVYAEVEASGDVEASEAPPAKPVRKRKIKVKPEADDDPWKSLDSGPSGRPLDPHWEGLKTWLGYEPGTPSGRGRWNRAIKELREIKATEEDIVAHGKAYDKRFPGMDRNPNALVAHWTELEVEAPGLAANPADVERAIKEAHYGPSCRIPNCPEESCARRVKAENEGE